MAAKADRSENLVRPRDFVDILSTDWLFRPITVFVYLAITLLPTTASELGRLVEPSLLVAIGVATLSVSVLGVLLFVVGITIPARARRSRLIVLFALMSVGTMRGIVVSGLVDSAGLEEHSHLWSRVILSTLSVAPVLALVSVVVSRIVSSRELAQSTQISIAETEQTRDMILADIRESDERLLTEVGSSLRPAIEKLTASVSGQSVRRAPFADSLSALATDLIRPLSHTLATNTSSRRFPRGPVTPQLSEVSAPTYGDQVNPVFLGLGVFLGSGTVLVDLLPMGNALVAALISGGFIYALMQVMVTVLGKTQLPYLAITAVNSAVLSVSWLPPHLFNEQFVFPEPLSFQPWAVSVVAMPILGLTYQLIVLGAYSRRNQLATLENTRRDMVFQLSEARRRAWLRQRHLTHTLHSTAQSRVLAEARLIRSGKGSLDKADVARTVSTLDSVLEVVKSDPPVVIDAIRGITDVVEFWAGMCEITLDVDPRAVPESDVEVAEAIHVIALEMISNAIRHGKATTIDITISREAADAIRVTSRNNGKPVATKRRAGLGVLLYSELAAEWEFVSVKPVTVTALIAARTNTMD